MNRRAIARRVQNVRMFLHSSRRPGPPRAESIDAAVASLDEVLAELAEGPPAPAADGRDTAAMRKARDPILLALREAYAAGKQRKFYEVGATAWRVLDSVAFRLNHAELQSRAGDAYVLSSVMARIASSEDGRRLLAGFCLESIERVETLIDQAVARLEEKGGTP